MARQVRKFTLEEFQHVEQMLKSGMSPNAIGKVLDRAGQVVCRLVERNGGKEAFNAKKAWDSTCKNRYSPYRVPSRKYTDAEIELIKQRLEEGISLRFISYEIRTSSVTLCKFITNDPILGEIQREKKGRAERMTYSLQQQVDILFEEIEKIKANLGIS